MMRMSLIVEKPSRELSVGEILSQSFNLYSARFAQFFIPFLVAGLVNEAFSTAVDWYFPLPPSPEPGAPLEVLLQWFYSFLAALIAALALTFILSWIVSTIAEGVIIKCASDILERGDARIRESFNFTISRLPSLLAAGIITGILIALGLICFILPGVILGVMFSLVVPVIIVERMGALESLARSRRLVSKRWGKTFILLLLISITILIASWIVDVIISPFSSALSSIISGVIIALIEPILPIVMTFLYYSMIVKESLPSIL